MSLSHKSTAAAAFDNPRGHKLSTSTRTPSSFDTGAYTRFTRIAGRDMFVKNTPTRRRRKAEAFRQGLGLRRAGAPYELPLEELAGRRRHRLPAAKQQEVVNVVGDHEPLDGDAFLEQALFQIHGLVEFD